MRDPLQRVTRRGGGSPQRSKRERKARQLEVQGTVLKVLDRRTECATELAQAIGDGAGVAVVAQDVGSFLQRQQHAGSAVVEGRVFTLEAYMVDQPVRRTTSDTLRLCSPCARRGRPHSLQSYDRAVSATLSKRSLDKRLPGSRWAAT